MESLEEQLEKLQMMTNQQLKSGKKIAPIVPPKPKSKSQPQVPKSCQIKQTCEPKYSTILQNTQLNFDQSTGSNISAKRNLNNTYSNIGVENSTNEKQEITKQKQQQQEENDRGGFINHSHATPRSYDSGRQSQLSSGGGSAGNGEFIPGRIYENQKLNVTSVQKPNKIDGNAGIIPPPPMNDIHGNNGPNLHIYSNAPLKKIDNKQMPNQNPLYSNISFENSHNYHPPPPLDVQVNQNYQECCDEEFPPPPSPVSSSYSELRRATDNVYPPISIYATQQLNKFNQMNHQMPGINHDINQQQYNMNNYNQTDYVTYGGISSQGSSTYESIYEPINPRPPSQMSTRSNYSLYTPYVEQGGKISSIKEAEVDALTDMLVNSMDNCQDVDSYGICVKCDERIVGENSGCTAMDQVYHIGCFTCYHCQINLQGKPFYSLDGKPYCEEDYLNTLEKCSVCVKPILERILRATGKPYHPGCFCCVVCGKSLDGIPFTVDALNLIHCIEDFHKKFAPRCCVCRLPIMPEPGQEETVRVVALDRSFHIACYKCEDCGLPLSSEAEGRGCYPLDDHVLCKSCNAKRVQMLTNHMTTEL